MRLIPGLSSVAIVTVLLATTTGARIASAGPDDCSISGMQGSYACPLSSWSPTPSTVPQEQVGTTSYQGCRSHYVLYSSHVKWVNDCPSVSELSPSASAPPPTR